MAKYWISVELPSKESIEHKVWECDPSIKSISTDDYYDIRNHIRDMIDDAFSIDTMINNAIEDYLKAQLDELRATIKKHDKRDDIHKLRVELGRYASLLQTIKAHARNVIKESEAIVDAMPSED